MEVAWNHPQLEFIERSKFEWVQIPLGFFALRVAFCQLSSIKTKPLVKAIESLLASPLVQSKTYKLLRRHFGMLHVSALFSIILWVGICFQNIFSWLVVSTFNPFEKYYEYYKLDHLNHKVWGKKEKIFEATTWNASLRLQAIQSHLRYPHSSAATSWGDISADGRPSIHTNKSPSSTARQTPEMSPMPITDHSTKSGKHRSHLWHRFGFWGFEFWKKTQTLQQIATTMYVLHTNEWYNPWKTKSEWESYSKCKVLCPSTALSFISYCTYKWKPKSH